MSNQQHTFAEQASQEHTPSCGQGHDWQPTIIIGDGQDLTPVTLNFKDVNGDGKLDMIIHIQDQTFVFINDGTQFRPLKPGEHITL